MITQHYNGTEPKVPADAVKGLAAYDAWCEAFRNQAVEPNGNAYNIVVFGDSRKYASQFLKEAALAWNDPEDASGNTGVLLEEAAETYKQIALVFDELHALFPYPDGGEPNNQDCSLQAIILLEKAKELETKGARQIENIWEAIN